VSESTRLQLTSPRLEFLKCQFAFVVLNRSDESPACLALNQLANPVRDFASGDV
jgi:hypothetical protein